jgi:hypothetical protein
MKKVNLFLLMIMALSGIANGQEYRVAKNSGRLELNIGRVTVEGHEGNEIIFTSANQKREKDERAEGLRLVNSLGLEDNTGLGIHVANKGDVVQVFQLKPTHSPDIKVLVPKNVIVSYKFESQYGGDIRFQKLTNEIEVSALYNSVKLEEVTGPLTIQTTYGSVTANFAAPIKDPVSIVSIYGFVDVTLPQSTKADLKLSTSYGDIYVAPEFNLQMASRDGMTVYSDKISGKINGGGVSMELDCNYGKIYLRKK